MDVVGDLTAELLSKEEIFTIPLTMRFDDEELVAEYSLEPAIILKKTKESKNCPKTACPPPGEFISFFEEHKDKRIYVLTLSSKLSGSYSSANMAKEIFLEDYPDAQICIIDSLSASAGEGLVCQMVLNFEALFHKVQEVEKAINDFVKSMRTIFVLEDLTFLEKNGRLSCVMKVATKLLSISPILEANEGEIVMKDKAVGNVRAIDKMINYIIEDLNQHKVEYLQISHCNALNKANKIKDAILAKFPDINITIAHTGPLATFYAGDKGVVCSY